MSRAPRSLIAPVVAAAIVASVALAAGAHPFVPDQVNDGSSSSAVNIQLLAPLGQEFVPALFSVNSVELMTWDFSELGPGADLQVGIRESTIDGTLLGTSELVSLPAGFSGLTHFDFASPVPLVRHRVYVIEVVVVSGDYWGVSTREAGTYPQGNMIENGRNNADHDLWFREGTDVLVGTRSSSWARVKALFR